MRNTAGHYPFAWVVLFCISAAAIAVGILALIGVVLVLSHSSQKAQARDADGRYAASPLKPWFDSLVSRKGPCCSDADGTALSDIDWEATKDGHYRVRIDGEWWDVPEEAVLNQPNLVGRTMVWPQFNRALGGKLDVTIRCFIPGPMI